MNNAPTRRSHGYSEDELIELTSRSASETVQLGRRLGALLLRAHGPARDGALIVALHGDLGAGKTTLTQGIAAGLGVSEPVTSPTFTLVREYALPAARFMHMDSYRLGDLPDTAASEAETFGIEELLDDPEIIMVIEWAERLADLLPADALHLKLSYAGEPESDFVRRIALWTGDAALAALLPQLLEPDVDQRI